MFPTDVRESPTSVESNNDDAAFVHTESAPARLEAIEAKDRGEGASPPCRTAILVLGMHRSGTSAFTRVFNLLGADLPTNLLPSNEGNQAGYWESADVWHLNDEILASAGSSWDDWRRFNPEWIRSPKKDVFKVRALELLDRDFNASALFALKDPRICRLLPFWMEVLGEFGAEPRCVIPIRSFAEVASSLAKRNGFGPTKSHMIWLRHVLDAEHGTRGLSRALISYDALLTNWRAVATQLKEGLDLAWPRRSATSEVEIDQFLGGGYRHHRVSDADTLHDPDAVDWVKSTYSALRELETNPESHEALRRLDAVREEFERASLALGSVLRADEMARSELEQRLAERNAHVEHLERVGAHWEQVAAERESQVNELGSEKQDLISEKQNLISERQDLISQRKKVDRLNRRLLRRLDEVQSSATWQLARPWRAVEGRLPRLVRGIAAVPRVASWTLKLRLTEQLKIRRLTNELLDTRGFDRSWYIERNPDVVLAGHNPILHWLNIGWKQGRNPNPRFDVARYLQQHPDVASSGVAALVHSMTSSVNRGREGRSVGGRGRKGSRPGHTRPLGPDEAGSEGPSAGMQVAFVSGEPRFQGHLYRVEHSADALRRAGNHAVCLDIEEVPIRLDELGDVDVLVIWRAPLNAEVDLAVKTAKRAGAKIMFDVDDLMFDPELARTEVIDGIRTQGLTEEGVGKHYQRVQNTIYRADACTCPTDALATALRKLGRPSFVLPNGFDEETVKASRSAVIERRCRVGDGYVRIGYAAGTRTHQKDFMPTANAVARILRSHPHCRLVLFGPGHDAALANATLDVSEYPALAAVAEQIEIRPIVPIRDLPKELARFDINLAPLEVGNPFCEAKSELKYFEAALVGVPTVASPTQPFRSAIRHGETGFLAESEADWFDALSGLVQDEGLRKRVGRDALHDVLWRYGPECRTDRLASIFGQVIGQKSQSAGLFERDLRRQQVSPQTLPQIPDFDVVFLREKPPVAAVAIVMPVYNYAHYVIEALESVKAQSLVNLELVVVDDRSTDDSLAVVQTWMQQNKDRFQRIALLQNRKNSFLGLARNTAFAFAEAPLILPLDPDNRLLPSCAEKCAQSLQGSPAAMAYPIIEKFGDGEGLMGTLPWSPARLVLGNYIDAMAMVRKSAWAAVGGYDNLFGWEDFDLWCKFSENGMWGVQVPEVLAQYRVHGQSMLKTHTHVGETERRLFEEVYRRHPWLDIAMVNEGLRQASDFSNGQPRDASDPSDEGSEAQQSLLVADTARAPNASPRAPRPHDRARLKELLPLLRCPVSHGALRISDDGTSILSDGGPVWPVEAGRPILFPGMTKVVQHPDSHVSNALCGRAVELIERAEGPVLNLSAGGSSRWYPHVVEAEASIFRNTDLVADAHALPFQDECFELVLAMNAFEHYANPAAVAAEIYRVLRPGGRIFLHTAFLQPLHEPPFHFYNCTKYGLARWFQEFRTLELSVSENFSPGFTISWLLSEVETLLRESASPQLAEAFSQSRIADNIQYWRDPSARRGAIWRALAALPQEAQERVAAGFQFLGQKE